MRIHCQGARFHAGQIARIEQGFRALGHEVTETLSDADLIYVNNPWFDQVLEDRRLGRFKPGAKLILDVQDIPWHCPDYSITRLSQQLCAADAVTSISETTRRDLFSATGINSTVVFQPIMPVTRTGQRKHPYRAMFVGRVWDGNKRAAIAARAFWLLGFKGHEVVTVGMETLPFGGHYWGVASEETLNDLYNSVDFVVATARYAGIELAIIEAMAAGAVPLVLSDLHTREELLPTDLFPEYTTVEPAPESLARFIASLINEDGGQRLAEFKKRLHLHYQSTWAERTSPEGVARRILQVYESIT